MFETAKVLLIIMALNGNEPGGITIIPYETMETCRKHENVIAGTLYFADIQYRTRHPEKENKELRLIRSCVEIDN